MGKCENGLMEDWGNAKMGYWKIGEIEPDLSNAIKINSME